MTISAPSPSNRIESIDSLRAIAALIVVYCHAWTSVSGDGYWGVAVFEFLRRDVFQNGHLGVTLFFVISGYVIPQSLLTHDSGNLRKFAISRVMRLYPAYWVSFAVFALLVGLPPETPGVWLNLTMVQRLFSVEDLIGVYWTLFVELAFYVSVALLFAVGLLGPGRKIDVLLVAIVTVTLLSAVVRSMFDLPLPAGNLMFLCLMYFGTWLRLAVYGNRKLVLVATFFLAAMLICSFLLYYPAQFDLPWHLHYAKFFLAVLIFVYALKAPKFGTAKLAYVGLISYSIYLFHAPILFVVEKHIASDGLIGRIEVAALALALTLVLSAIVFHLVEAPCIALGKRLGKFNFFGRAGVQTRS